MPYRFGRARGPQTLAVYDFAADIYSSAVTYARTGTAYSENLAGVYTSFADNILRRTDKGAAVEPAATNLIRNNSMQGAVVATPGTMPTNWSSITTSNGLSRRVVGLGSEDGLDYIDLRYLGTATATTGYRAYFETTTGIALAPNGLATASAFLKLISGGGISNFALALTNYNSVGTLVGEIASTNVTLPTSLTRSTVVANAASFADPTTAFVRPYVSIEFLSGAVVDITFRVAMPQTEAGSLITTPIRTTSATVTRPADQLSFTAPAGISGLTTLYSDGSNFYEPATAGVVNVAAVTAKQVSKIQVT